MLKKAGIVTVGVAASLVAVSPLAFAGDKGHGHHESDKDIKNVGVKNGFAWALSPTVEILTFDATADGMCDGMKNAPMRGTSIYVKEGDAWKITFGFVSPAGKM